MLEGHLYHIRNSGDQLSILLVTIIWLTFSHFICDTFWEKVCTDGVGSCYLRSWCHNDNDYIFHTSTNLLDIPVTTFWLTRKVKSGNNDKDLKFYDLPEQKERFYSVRLCQGKSEIVNTCFQVTKFDLPGSLQGNEDKTTMYCL